MASQRRSFLKLTALFAGSSLLTKPANAFSAITRKMNSLNQGRTVTIYQTSNLNVKGLFRDFQGLRRAVSNQDTAGILLDAGNFISLKANSDQHLDAVLEMNKIGYHAVGLGVHELYNGQEYLMELCKQMQFPVVSCNYTFNHTALARLVNPYTIVSTKYLKIGITAVGAKISTDGVLVKNPYTALNATARYLKEEAACDLVICLSHLEEGAGGWTSRELGEKSAHVDLIVDAHSQTSLTKTSTLRNVNGHEVVLTQTGNSGSVLGKSRFGFNAEGFKCYFEQEHILPEHPSADATMVYNRLKEFTNKATV